MHSFESDVGLFFHDQSLEGKVQSPLLNLFIILLIMTLKETELDCK